MTHWESEPVAHGFGPEQLWYQRRGVVIGILAALAVAILLLVTLLTGSGDDAGQAEPDDSTPITFLTTTTEAPAATTTEPPATTAPTETTAPSVTTTEPPATTTTIAPGQVTVWDLLQTRSNLTRAAELLVIAELDDVMRGADPFTFFAPTNEALADFEATARGRAIVADQGRLTTFLLRHLAFPRALTVAQIYSEGYVLVATGEFLDADAATATLDGVAFLLVDDAAGNGVLHVMDDVLAP